MKRSLLTLSLCLLALPVLAQAPDKDKAKAKPASVVVAKVQAGEFFDLVEGLGTLRANESVDLTATVAKTVTAINFKDGQRVQAGAALMNVVPIQTAYVDANFKEVQLRKIRVGSPVVLTSDLYGGRVKYHGRVVGLARRAPPRRAARADDPRRRAAARRRLRPRRHRLRAHLAHAPLGLDGLPRRSSSLGCRRADRPPGRRLADRAGRLRPEARGARRRAPGGARRAGAARPLDD